MGERLVDSEIHGFHTLRAIFVRICGILKVLCCIVIWMLGPMMEEAKTRWLRPNEIHAILCNSKYFSINAKPVNLPKSNYFLLQT
ncbi:hypothetical protein Patl1_24925 [Pistacia atlantica]|uniref:Uncharacterized protein n=1 Tax=Pistacia atlantica TaxID=434234 RepID=A0ACC1AYV1_9ROSI|nr:hypothetical protein Patl1_24925 [Pistacia atlantica]